MRILVPLLSFGLALATPVAAAPFDAGKCIIGSAALVPKSPATTLKAANVRSMTSAEAKNYPQGGTWVDVQVEALGASATYTFMCGQGSDGATKVWLMR